MNAPTSANSEITTANIPINLVEIDNENYFYSLLILAVEDWSLFKLYGTSIEYRDM